MATKSVKTSKKPAKPAQAAKTKTPAAAVKTAKPAAPKNAFAALRNWNIRIAAVLAAEAVAVVVAGGTQTVPITTQYLSANALASEAAGHQVLAVATRHLVDVRLSWVVAKFLLIFAVVYLLTGTLLRKRYEAGLNRGVSKFRWVGFGIGTGVMADAIAMLSGISDLGYLIMIFGSFVVLGGLATITELIGGGRKLRKFGIVTALFTVALPVLAIAFTALGVFKFGGDLPTFVYYIYTSMLLVTVAFVLACIFRLRQRGKWADTIYTEKMFMLLGLVAASILAWQIFAGALQ